MFQNLRNNDNVEFGNMRKGLNVTNIPNDVGARAFIDVESFNINPRQPTSPGESTVILGCDIENSNGAERALSRAICNVALC
jgi:hypothetical protein